MVSFDIYEFFNNATIAATVAILLAGFIASIQYRKQKKIDRDTDIKRDIILDLISLKEKTHYILLIVSRIVNSYQQTKKFDEDFIKVISEYEIPRLSNTINNVIPSLDIRIVNKLDIYFRDNEEINNSYKKFQAQLIQWHAPIVKKEMSLFVKLNDQPKLSLDSLDAEINQLIKSIWEERLS